MKQCVSITRSADRHAEHHGRDFAHTETFTVEAGPLENVLALVMAESALARQQGRFVLIVDWPHESASA